MSIRMIELERAVHIERESLREGKNRNRQEVSTSENRLRLKNKTDEYLARNLSRLMREVEERKKHIKGDLKQFQSQQEQTLGKVDTRIDATMERRNHGHIGQQ